MKVALVGATGLVGTVMLKVLEESGMPITELIPVASERSVGKKVKFDGREFEIHSLSNAVDSKPDIALFSAGSGVSLEWAPKFAENGTYVIDNSSAWRMDPDKKLIVPEINADALTKEDRIIANPNCSTIQMVLVLDPLHKKFGLKRVIVSTYQSVTGTGVKAVQQMENERKGVQGEMAYRYAIDRNAIPQIDVFLENAYTKEEMKMANETKKILRNDTIGVSATCVRIPVMGGHSESVNAEFDKPVSANEAREILSHSSGIIVKDDIENFEYPMPLIHSEGRNEVFVGRIREDYTNPNTLNMWIVADNLRKGAATNAVQIADYIRKQGWF